MKRHIHSLVYEQVADFDDQKARFSLTATISYQPSHFRNSTYISSYHVPLYNDPQPSFFSDLQKRIYKPTFIFFLSSFP